MQYNTKNNFTSARKIQKLQIFVVFAAGPMTVAETAVDPRKNCNHRPNPIFAY